MLPFADGQSSSVECDMQAIFGVPSTESQRAPRELLPIELTEAPRRKTKLLVPTASLTVAVLIAGLGISLQRHELIDWAQAATAAPPARAASRLPTNPGSAPVAASAAAVNHAPQPLVSNSDAEMIDVADRKPSQRNAPTRAVLPRFEPEAVTAKAETPDAHQSCGNLDRWARDDCMHADIVKADRELRMAYARAVDDGVNERVLYRYQVRWSRLLDRAYSDPDRVTAMLGSMARQLDDEQTGI